MAKKKTRTRKAHSKKVWKWLLGIGITLLITAICGYFYVTRSTGANEDIRVYLYGDTDDDNLEQRLRDVLPREYVSAVMISYKLLGGIDSDKHLEGSYVVSPDLPAIKFANNLRHQRQTPVKMTLTYGRTFGDVAKRISEQMETDSVSFHQAADSIFRSKGYIPEQFTALIIPDSHEFYWTATPGSIVERLYGSYVGFWNDERTKKATKTGLTPVEVSTLASIVESETAKSDEKPLVARLYLNRLKEGMKLQADPTVIFATGDFGIKRVTGVHLKINSPYNTYIHQGLPPGPIKIPTKEGIDAVLNAPRHNYIYMCAKEDFSGYHNFAASYKEHQENAALYRRELNRRGIK